MNRILQIESSVRASYLEASKHDCLLKILRRKGNKAILQDIFQANANFLEVEKRQKIVGLDLNVICRIEEWLLQTFVPFRYYK